MVVKIRVIIYGHDTYKKLTHEKRNGHTAKLTPLEINTILETDLVPPAQGRTHCPEAPAALHDEPGPLTGSKPAANASDWNRVIENPSGPTPYIDVNDEENENTGHMHTLSPL